MRRLLVLSCLCLATFTLGGCGSASGIKPGIPDNPQAAPVNPTDDMSTPGPAKAPK